jgi:hypothetical protein
MTWQQSFTWPWRRGPCAYAHRDGGGGDGGGVKFTDPATAVDFQFVSVVRAWQIIHATSRQQPRFRPSFD